MVNTVERPNWDEYFMTICCLASIRSKDTSTKHGAVIVDVNNHILGVGYNGSPSGSNDSIYPTERPDKYYTTIHAEENAIYNCIKRPDGGTIYITGMPCSQCTKCIIANGIKKVIIGNIGSTIVDKTNLYYSNLMFNDHNISVVNYSEINSNRHPKHIYNLVTNYLINKEWAS